MKGLKTLIRLATYKLDEKRVLLMDYSQRYAVAQNQITKLEEKLTQESRVAQGQAPQLQEFFFFFEQNSQRLCQDLRQRQQWLNGQMYSVRQEVLKFFQEKKSYEIALKSFYDQQLKKERAEEQKVLDEIAARANRHLLH